MRGSSFDVEPEAAEDQLDDGRFCRDVVDFLEGSLALHDDHLAGKILRSVLLDVQFLVRNEIPVGAVAAAAGVQRFRLNRRMVIDSARPGVLQK